MECSKTDIFLCVFEQKYFKLDMEKDGDSATLGFFAKPVQGEEDYL